MNLGYIGRTSHHSENLRLLLASRGLDLQIYEDSVSLGVYSMRTGGRFSAVARRWGQFRRLRSQFEGVRDAGYRQGLIDALDRDGVDCLLAFWGTNPIAEVIAVKTLRPRVKTILNLLCHPMGITPTRIRYQNFLLRRASRYLDGIIYPSRVMKEYVESRCKIRVRSAVLPPKFSKEYFAAESLPPREESPNVLFLGRMDWWAGQPSDNLEAALDRLIAEGIHVFHSRSSAALARCDRRHQFEPLPLSALHRFATQFDASFVEYNRAASPCGVRFRATIPDRLLSSVASGIPVALPRTGYEACREFLNDYPAVIEYGTTREFAEKLRDREALGRAKEAARKVFMEYAGENQMTEYLDFVASVVG